MSDQDIKILEYVLEDDPQMFENIEGSRTGKSGQSTTEARQGLIKSLTFG